MLWTCQKSKMQHSLKPQTNFLAFYQLKANAEAPGKLNLLGLLPQKLENQPFWLHPQMEASAVNPHVYEL